MFKRIINFFKEDQDQEPKEENKTSYKSQRRHIQRNIEAKMTYKYPKNTPFRFPVIPDEEPAIQRRQERRREARPNHQTSQRIRPETRERTRPFTPSRVPSPIYGYKKQINPEIHETPAYIRKQKTIEEDKIKQEDQGPSRKPKEENTAEENSRPRENKLINLGQEKEQAAPIHTPIERRTRPKREKPEQETRVEARKQIQQENKQIPLHLLEDPIPKNSEDYEWVEEQKHLLEETLRHFKVDAKVVNMTQGPTVTRFEVQPELGVKVSRVRNLSDDIKMNMAAKDIRIEAPIPGKNTIGIEVPNRTAQKVGLQEIIESEKFLKHSSKLAIGLGLTLEGESYITTIDKMPHGLIAGATGSGKSVCINTIILSLMYKSSYEDVKLLLIDPKMVELAPYNGIPHLLAPVITDVKAATAALKWAVNEMEERYESFAETRVRDIDRYNEKAVELGREKMPHIVIIIDELADLMMMSPQDVEDSICRIAQKARACGMHLLIATQRPSVDVITGLIKANIPTRIAFSVSSQVDSRTIIDSNGAERLLGKGDMLFAENGSGHLIRLQGAFVSDEEIERITNFARDLAEPNYLFEQDELLEQIDFDDEMDDLFEDVIQFILEHEQASTSLLQRHFRIGYNRAARIIDSLEERGMISEQRGSRPRDVLFTIDQLDEFL